ncbi:protease, partial [Streptomyces sp. NPDC056045]
MEDGKSTGPKAKWWSRPTPGRATRTTPDESSFPVEDAPPAAGSAGAPTAGLPVDAAQPSDGEGSVPDDSRATAVPAAAGPHA